MNHSSNHLDSEVNRDLLLQSSLAYWSSSVRSETDSDPICWEAERPDLSGITRLTVPLVVLVLTVLVLWQVGL